MIGVVIVEETGEKSISMKNEYRDCSFHIGLNKKIMQK